MQIQSAAPTTPSPHATDAVVFRGDGEPWTPLEQARLLAEIAADGIDPDNYSLGGAVATLERTMADKLGKEAAVFLPTGTLANHLAVRRLAGGRPRVVVQAESHLYNDSGDCATRISGLNLVPLAPGQVCFSPAELTAAVDRAESGRVLVPVGAVVVESPVRRVNGRIVSLEDMTAIAQICRERRIGLHLDGARLYMMSAATGVPLRAYSALFDTVYVSLWKYLGAPFGAILAGPAALLEGLYHERRAFGGALPHAWMAAALCLRGLEGFEERFTAAMARASELCAALSRLPGVDATPYPDGSNVLPLRLEPSVDRDRLIARLAERGVQVGGEVDRDGALLLTVNTTILRRPLEAVVAAFAESLG